VDFNDATDAGLFWGGTGIGKRYVLTESAPRSRQITMPTPHQLISKSQKICLLMPNQQYHSTECNPLWLITACNNTHHGGAALLASQVCQRQDADQSAEHV